MWLQGERDSLFEYVSAEYHDSFSAFIEQFRKDTGLPNLPVVIGLVSASKVADPYVDVVRSAQEEIASDVHNVEIVETKGLSKSDPVHSDSNGQIQLGGMLFNTI